MSGTNTEVVSCQIHLPDHPRSRAGDSAEPLRVVCWHEFIDMFELWVVCISAPDSRAGDGAEFVPSVSVEELFDTFSCPEFAGCFLALVAAVLCVGG